MTKTSGKSKKSKRSGKSPANLKQNTGQGKKGIPRKKTGFNIKPAKIIYGLLTLIIIASVVTGLSSLYIANKGVLKISYPFDGSVFPPEIISPRIWWSDEDSDADTWRVTIDFEDSSEPFIIEVDTIEWTPDKELWEDFKRRSVENQAKITVEGIVKFAGISRTLSSGSVSITTSEDSVNAPIYYRDVPLPFRFALRNVPMIKWRLGNISSYEEPPVVLSDLPVCGNCHSFSADGSMLGMDVDIGNDKGAYILTEFKEETIFSKDKLISWTDFTRGQDVATFGMLPRIAPSGKYVLAGLKDRTVFLPRPDIMFSQIFFPVMGIIAYYDRNTGEIHALSGADDEEYVQSNGVWSPDGEYVIFARNKAVKLKTDAQFKDIILNREESAEVLGGEEFLDKAQEGGKKFKFSLYKVPFNNGRGGDPVPIEGASHNDKSNFFPAVSPDGKWLVFTQTHSYMLLQPDSKLYIMPAEGGAPRLMNCNTDRMNSWHSWSPNNKWLVFSSKQFGPYTQLFLTHIDENGNDSPPVLLRNFTPHERAANIPEFVNMDPKESRVVKERFLDDYSYFRAGRIYENFNEFERAEEEYRKSLEMNPENRASRYSLGTIYSNNKDYEQARDQFIEVIKYDPENAIVRTDLGSVYLTLKDYDKAEDQFKEALRIDQNHAAAHHNLASLYLIRNDIENAIAEYKRAIAVADQSQDVIRAHFNLGGLYISQKDYTSAKTEFERVIELDPGNTDAYSNLGTIYDKLGDSRRAEEMYTKITETEPKDVEGYNELGNYYFKSRDYEKAKESFQKTLEIVPNNAFARLSLGRIYTETKEYHNASRLFMDMIRDDPKDLFAHINLGRVYTETNRYDDAITEFKTVLQINPNEVNAYFMLGELYVKNTETYKEAIANLRKGLSINPVHFNARILLGNVLIRTGDIQNAIDEFEFALKLNPSAPDLRNTIQELKKRIK
ncbi:MAG: tetratricopeptide repeat protein [bacterium]|nr:tetratricopeptide repeat protein [bacterium]